MKDEYYAELYRKGKLNAPDSIHGTQMNAIDPEGRKHALDWCRYVYGAYCSQAISCLVDSSVASTARAYAAGTHERGPFKKLFDVRTGKKDEKGRRTGNEVVSQVWSPTALLGKFVNIAVDKAASQSLLLTVRAIDTASNQERRKIIAKDKLITDPRMQRLMEMSATSAATYKPVSSPEDVDLLAEMGEYALPSEMILENGVTVALELTGFDLIKRQIAEDLIALKRGAAEVYWDSVEQRPAVRYCDPAGLIMPLSAYNDYRDARYAASLSNMSIREIRDQYTIGDGDLERLCQTYKSHELNSAMSGGFNQGIMGEGMREDFSQRGNRNWSDSMRVRVMKLTMIDYDTRTYVERNRKDGNYVFDEVQKGAKARGAKVFDMGSQAVFEILWVVGTDMILKYDRKPYVVRTGTEGYKRAMLPIIVYGATGVSMVEACKEPINKIEVAKIKISSLFENLPPGPRMAIDMTKLADVLRIGDQEYDLHDILKIYAARGILVYQSNPSILSMPNSSDVPVVPLPGAILEDYNALIAEISFQINEIRQFTGINEVVDGSGTGRDVLNGVADVMSQGTNAALGYVYAGIESISQRINTCIAHQITSKARSGEFSIRNLKVESGVAQIINMMPADVISDFDIITRPGPSAEELMAMNTLIQNSVMAGKIDYGDSLLAMDALRRGNIKLASIIMSRSHAKQRQLAHQQQIEVSTAQAQAQGQAAVTAEEARQMSDERRFQYNRQLQQDRLAVQVEVAKMKAAGDMEGAILDIATNVSNSPYQVATSPPLAR